EHEATIPFKIPSGIPIDDWRVATEVAHLAAGDGSVDEHSYMFKGGRARRFASCSVLSIRATQDISTGSSASAVSVQLKAGERRHLTNQPIRRCASFSLRLPPVCPTQDKSAVGLELAPAAVFQHAR